jgi:WD40 repeat protein
MLGKLLLILPAAFAIVLGVTICSQPCLQNAVLNGVADAQEAYNESDVLNEIDTDRIRRSLGASSFLFGLLDWSPHGKGVLLKYVSISDRANYGYRHLAIVDPEGKDSIPLNFAFDAATENAKISDRDIVIAKFSPSDPDLIYLLLGYMSEDAANVRNIYSYNMQDGDTLQLTSSGNVLWFDVTSTGRQLVVAEVSPYSPVSGTTYDKVWLAHASNGTRIAEVSHNIPGGAYFTDLGPDDSSIVATRLGEDSVTIFDIRTGSSTTATHPNGIGIYDVKWAPNGDYLVYSGTRSFPFRASAVTDYIGVIGKDGSASYELVTAPAEQYLRIVTMLISPDGKRLLFGSEGGYYPDLIIATKMYELNIAAPVAEFGFPLPLAIAVSIAAVTLAARHLGRLP